MSFTEFTYQLVQGYDFYWLYKNKTANSNGRQRPVGATSQREPNSSVASPSEAFAFTCPLLTSPTAESSEKRKKEMSGSIPERPLPFSLSVWLNATDSRRPKWIKIFTSCPQRHRYPNRKPSPDPGARLSRRPWPSTSPLRPCEEGYQRPWPTPKKCSPTSPRPRVPQRGRPSVPRRHRPLRLRGSPPRQRRSHLPRGNRHCFLERRSTPKLIQGGGIASTGKKWTRSQFSVDASLLLHGKYILVQREKELLSVTVA